MGETLMDNCDNILMELMMRECTCRILELVDENAIDPKWLVEVLLMWMSEDDVREFSLKYDLMEYWSDENDQ